MGAAAGVDPALAPVSSLLVDTTPAATVLYDGPLQLDYCMRACPYSVLVNKKIVSSGGRGANDGAVRPHLCVYACAPGSTAAWMAGSNNTVNTGLLTARTVVVSALTAPSNKM